MENFNLDIKKINEACQTYHVDTLFLFGSHAKGTFTSKSDYDFLVYFKPIDLLEYGDNFFEFTYELEKIVGKKVDLVSGKAMKNPFFIKEVEATKRLIYG